MPQEALRDEIKAEREAYVKWMEQVDVTRLIMIDESGLCLGMRLGYGYAPCGKRAFDRAPARRGARLNLIGWIDYFGNGFAVKHWGTVNGAIFRCFVEQHLAPELEAGDIVVWDNARIHDDPELVGLVEARGATVKRLPRYSPDFNPIEMLWSKLKHYVKKRRPDTREGLVEALDEAGKQVRGENAAGWFQHCGFRPHPT